MGFTPHVIIVGGGLVGTATARDLAMRGLEVTLVEQDTLASGATGGADGLLESGVGYAVANETLARHCAKENRTLRKIASHCIEETGCLFVEQKGDDGYYGEILEAAREAEIPVEELSTAELREREPALSNDVERGFEVPAASVDPDCLTVATARSAREYGATVHTRTEVTDLLVEDTAVRGVEIQTRDGESGILRAQFVVNAAGPSAGEVAGMAGLDVPVRDVTRTTLVINDRPTERIIRRVDAESADERIVPRRTRSVLGTAGRGGDPTSTVEAVDRTIAEFEELVPEVAEARFLRGGRPAFVGAAGEKEIGGGGSAMTVLDHEERDDVWGLSTVFGGTLTTHRLVAERAATTVCEKFGIDRPSHTGSIPLPGSVDEPDATVLADEAGLDGDVLEASVRRLGDRTSDVLTTDGPNPVVCLCEKVTRAEVKDALSDETAGETDLEAVRVRTGAGRGPCQGGRCVHRLASPLYLETDKGTIEREVETFLQNRWDEQRPVLWGEQLATAMETYALHATTMNRDKEPADVDLDGFDSGPEWDDDEIDPYGGLFP